MYAHDNNFKIKMIYECFNYLYNYNYICNLEITLNKFHLTKIDLHDNVREIRFKSVVRGKLRNVVTIRSEMLPVNRVVSLDVIGFSSYYSAFLSSLYRAS